MFSLLQIVFWTELLTLKSDLLGRFELKNPGAVFGLVAGVESFVVGLAGLPHLPEDFEPALAHAAERAGVTLAFGAMGLGIRLSTGAAFGAVIGPGVAGGASSGSERHG